jgi:hypothetical protein
MSACGHKRPPGFYYHERLKSALSGHRRAYQSNLYLFYPCGRLTTRKWTVDVFDLLMVGVEASIALAGFAGVIATYQINDVTMVRRGPVGALTVIVQYSLMAALTCGVCLCLSAFGLTGKDLWATSSLVGATLIMIGAYNIAKLMSGAITKRSIKMLFLSLQGIGVIITLALILNALDLVFHREPGPFIVGIMYALSVASYMFSRLLLLPLWRIVHEQEARDSTVTSSG